MLSKYGLVLLAVLMAPTSFAAMVPRQETSSSTSPTTSLPSTSSAPTPTTTVGFSTTDSPTSAGVASTPPAASTTTTSASAQQFVSVGNSGSLTTIVQSGSSLLPTATAIGNSTNLNSTQPPAACSAATYALNGTAAPFCLPANGTAWIQNTSYPVTWDPSFWPAYTGNVVIALLYTGQDGSNVITQQNEIANQRGFINVDVDESWLNGNTVVAAQLLIAADAATATNGGAHWGPIITLQDSATPFDTSPPKFNGHSLAVVIAVPVSVFVFLLFSCAVCYFTRKYRKLPEGIVIPRNGRKPRKGYAEGRSKRTRVGVEKTPGEFELGTVSGYRDEPTEGYTDFPENGRPGN